MRTWGTTTQDLTGPWGAALSKSPLHRACVLQLLQPACGGLMWRTQKADLDPQELGIPPQTAHTSQLAFSAVERYFYNRQHQVESQAAVNLAAPGPQCCSGSCCCRKPCCFRAMFKTDLTMIFCQAQASCIASQQDTKFGCM